MKTDNYYNKPKIANDPFVGRFIIILGIIVLILMIFEARASNRYFEKADFRYRYGLTNKEFRELRKSGAIQDTVIKWCAKPKVVYKSDTLKQKILIENDIWYYETKKGMEKVRY